jgi:hypothetical protein
VYETSSIDVAVASLNAAVRGAMEQAIRCGYRCNTKFPHWFSYTLRYYSVAYLRHTRIVTSKHAPRLRNHRWSGVFSVPCRAEPKRADESRTDPAVNELPGDRRKHLGCHVTATAVMSRPSNEATIASVLAAYQLQGFIRVRNSNDQPVLASSLQEQLQCQLEYSSRSWNTVTFGIQYSTVIGSRQPRGVRSWRRIRSRLVKV